MASLYAKIVAPIMTQACFLLPVVSVKLCVTMRGVASSLLGVKRVSELKIGVNVKKKIVNYLDRHLKLKRLILNTL